jgi:hypothetical protein
VVDTGLAVAAVGLTTDRLASVPRLGAMLESYVVTELRNQSALVDMPLFLGHFRDHSGVEVYVIVETPDGQVVGIEVKSATTPTALTPADSVPSRSPRLPLPARPRPHDGAGQRPTRRAVWVAPVSVLWGGD